MLYLRARFPKEDDPRHVLHSRVRYSENDEPLTFGRLDLDRYIDGDKNTLVERASLSRNLHNFISLPNPVLLFDNLGTLVPAYFNQPEMPMNKSWFNRLLDAMGYDRVSREHFQISWDNGFYIVDKGSSNGTLVDITKVTEEPLSLETLQCITISPKKDFSPALLLEIEINPRRSSTRRFEA